MRADDRSRTAARSHWLRWRAVGTILGALFVFSVVAACTASPDGSAIDWTDASQVVTLGGGWGMRHCEGDAPLWCLDDDGAPAGTIEVVRYPIASFATLADGATIDEKLRILAQDFTASIAADRAVGCGPGYEVRPHEPREFAFAGSAALAYGFTGVLADGSPSELNLQFATITGDEVVIVVAAGYDGNGCPGPDHPGGFDSASLSAVQPHLEAALRASRAP